MTDTPPAADTVTETPAPEPAADTATADEVAKWKALARKHEAEVKALRPKAAKADELEQAQLTEAEKAAQRAADAEARAAAAELSALRLQVALDKGLTPKQAARLQGATAEELAADADEFLADLGPNRPPGRPVEQLQSGAAPVATADTADPDAWIRKAVAARSGSR